MLSILIFCAIAAAGPSFLRGGAFHNLMVARADAALRREHWETALEYPVRLADGRTDYLDIRARRFGLTLAIEVETTPRYVQVNVGKARILDLPLWILVPTRRVRAGIQRRLLGDLGESGGRPIQILLLNELSQRLAICFPLFSLAIPPGKTGPTGLGPDAADRQAARAGRPADGTDCGR